MAKFADKLQKVKQEAKAPQRKTQKPQSQKKSPKKTSSVKKNRKPPKKNIQDTMAVAGLYGYALCVSVASPLFVVALLFFMPPAYDGAVVAIPPIVTQIAPQGGILHRHHAKSGDDLKAGDKILSLSPSSLKNPNPRAARDLTELQVMVSRLETQQLGSLDWQLPEELRLRALEDDDFAEYVIAEQKEFDDYYHSLDKYGKDIYLQQQRLNKRIADARKAIKGFETEKQYINARLIKAKESEKSLLRREVTYIDNDIARMYEVRRDLQQDLTSLEPRMQRLIQRKSAELQPFLSKLYKKRQRLYNKLGIREQNFPQLLRSPRHVRVGEIINRVSGDTFAAGEVLYRLLPNANSQQEVTLIAHLPEEAYQKLQLGDEVEFLLSNMNQDMKPFPAILVEKFENPESFPPAQRYGTLYHSKIDVIHDKLHRFPKLQEKGALILPVPPDERWQGVWRRMLLQKRPRAGEEGGQFVAIAKQHLTISAMRQNLQKQRLIEWLSLPWFRECVNYWRDYVRVLLQQQGERL